MRLLQVSIEEDLSIYSKYLWQQAITHRIFEEAGQQVVELSRGEDAERAMKAYGHWQAGQLVATPIPKPAASSEHTITARLRQAPGVCGLLLLSLVIYPFASGAWGDPYTPPVAWLTMAPLGGALPSNLSELIRVGEYWRWFTPVFLHFSIMHLAFNGAVVWELGRRAEGRLHSTAFVALVLLTGIGSNLTQYFWQTDAYFGGLSGIAYGLLGFLLVLQRLRPLESAWAVHRGFAMSMLVFLVVFTTGLLESSLGFRVANAAHWSGLGLGIVFGAVTHRLLREDANS